MPNPLEPGHIPGQNPLHPNGCRGIRDHRPGSAGGVPRIGWSSSPLWGSPCCTLWASSGTEGGVCVRHPVEIFDSALLRQMSEALRAAKAIVRLAGTDASNAAQFGDGATYHCRGGARQLHTAFAHRAALDGAWCR